MTDDYSGKHPDGRAPDSESDELTEEKKEWLNRLPSTKDRYKEPADLPQWSKLAIAKKMLGRYDTWKEAAEDHDRAPSTFSKYRNSPAGKKYRKQFAETVDDPAKLAENILRGELHNFTVDFMTMWQTAVDSNDYHEIRRMWETVMDRVPGGMSKQGDAGVGNASITINFGSPQDLEPIEVESEFDEIEADYEVVEDADN